MRRLNKVFPLCSQWVPPWDEACLSACLVLRWLTVLIKLFHFYRSFQSRRGRYHIVKIIIYTYFWPKKGWGMLGCGRGRRMMRVWAWQRDDEGVGVAELRWLKVMRSGHCCSRQDLTAGCQSLAVLWRFQDCRKEFYCNRNMWKIYRKVNFMLSQKIWIFPEEIWHLWAAATQSFILE